MVPFAQYYQRAKNVIHAVQALAIFVAWAITIAILTKGGRLGGRIWYYFVLCWCCIPALIYQTASPVFLRIRRFSNAYVHAIIDIVYTILWLSAFACLISWVEQGSHAAKDWKSKDSLCETFAWGPVTKCKLGRDAWIMAIIICTLFAVTASFSVYGVSYYKKHGSLPVNSVHKPEHLPIEDQDFSAVPGDKLNGHETMQLNHPDEDDTQSLHTNAGEQGLPSGYNNWNLQQPHIELADSGFNPVNTSYHGSGHPYDSSHHPLSRPAFQYSANNAPYHTPHSSESRILQGPKPLPTQMDGRSYRHSPALNYNHNGYASGDRVDFPEGDYGR